jgi:hypothetical protein
MAALTTAPETWLMRDAGTSDGLAIGLSEFRCSTQLAACSVICGSLDGDDFVKSNTLTTGGTGEHRGNRLWF